MVTALRLALAALAVLLASAADDIGPFTYGPSTVRPALFYFKHWLRGMVLQQLDHQAPVPEGSNELKEEAPWSAEHASMLLREHRRGVCREPPPEVLYGMPVAFEVHESEVDADGVRHAILRRVGTGHLQYVALRRGSVLAMDPPACDLRFQARSTTLSIQRKLTGQAGPADGGGKDEEQKSTATEEHGAHGDTTDDRRTTNSTTTATEAAKSAAQPTEGTTSDEVDALAKPLHLGDPKDLDGEKEELLHPRQDHLVIDCVGLFERTAKENCKKNLTAEVLSASLEIINGLQVRVHAKIHGAASEPVLHRFFCDFVPADKTEAMEDWQGNKSDEALPEEQQGMKAVLVMHVDICASDATTTVSPPTAKALRLFEQYRFGELSLLKGYRHVYNGLPKWLGDLQGKAEVPADFSLLTAFPECFPDNGRQVVRNQGQCGSCWAFASASATMATICTKGRGNNSLTMSRKRHEVSVQRIISCNSFDFGCEGGHALAAEDSFKVAKMSKDSVQPYQCSGGNALDHFLKASPDCEAVPWGGSSDTCESTHANSAWNFDQVYALEGSKAFISALLDGHALFVGFMVYPNFLSHKGHKVYNETSGSVAGGHAVVCVGYGLFDPYTPYWLLQNSWGPDWGGNNGFVMFARGRNLAEVETMGLKFKAWPNSVLQEPDSEPVPSLIDRVRHVPGLIQYQVKNKLALAALAALLLPMLCACIWCGYKNCCCRCCHWCRGGAAGDYESMPGGDPSPPGAGKPEASTGEASTETAAPSAAPATAT